jgi:hypothetical protein
MHIEQGRLVVVRVLQIANDVLYVRANVRQIVLYES